MTLKIDLPDWEVGKKALSEIVDKMQAIERNLEFLKDKTNIVLPEPSQYYGYIDIDVDLSSQYDEFYIIDTYNNATLLNIEVVTRKTAISNDKDFLDDSYSVEDRKSYKLGKVLSYYKKLGDSKYWYREL